MGLWQRWVMLLGFCVACTEAPGPPRKEVLHWPELPWEIVSASPEGFEVAGQRLRVFGANAALIHGPEARRDAPRLMDAMASDGLNVLRVWALGESPGTEPWRREVAFRVGKDEWVEESYAYLDRLLALATQRRQRLVLVLGNRWGARGGLPQYWRWAGGRMRHRNLMPAELLAALRSEDVRSQYREHLRRVVGRVSDAGPYRDSPAIFAWEIINELSASTCSAQEAAFDFTAEMAREIRRLDPNHLIGAGSIGYNSEGTLRLWRRVHSLPEIGYADTHGYPENLMDATTPARFGDWLSHRSAEAVRLGKPLLVGEVGVPANAGRWSRGGRRPRGRRRSGDEPGWSREAWLRAFYARARREGVGVLTWIYRPWIEGRDDPHGIWPWGQGTGRSSMRWALLGASRRREERFKDTQAEPWPLGVERIGPFPTGDWQGEERDAPLSVDPWGMSEGCTVADESWLSYGVAWRPGRPFSFDVARATEGRLRVFVDGELAGHWNGRRRQRWQPVRELAPDASLLWLRLEAEDEAGAALLQSWAQELPPELGSARDLRLRL